MKLQTTLGGSRLRPLLLVSVASLLLSVRNGTRIEAAALTGSTTDRHSIDRTVDDKPPFRVSNSHNTGAHNGPDSSPPEASLSPWGGTFSTSNANVTITWCDDSSLNAPTRQVKLDGATLY